MLKLFNRDFHKDVLQLFIGDYVVTKQKDILLSTVLGPCIAVCLKDKKTGVLGMNHFMLPGASGCDDARYGYDSMQRLIEEMKNLGANTRRLTAKIFGGARILPEGNISVANANVSFIESYLEQRQIPLEASDTGSCYGRRIYYCSDTHAIHLLKFGRKPCLDQVKEKYVVFD